MAIVAEAIEAEAVKEVEVEVAIKARVNIKVEDTAVELKEVKVIVFTAILRFVYIKLS
jgi:hypothetical protein